MDILGYLRQTTPGLVAPDLAGEEPLLGWMAESLDELALTTPFNVIPIDSSDVSHKYVNFSGRHYIVWDVALNSVLRILLTGLQYDRLANSAQSSLESTKFRSISSAAFRHALFVYLNRKLSRFPRTARAFSILASDYIPLTKSLSVPEADIVAELLSMQRMLMFYHEMSHALHVERPEFRHRAITALSGILNKVGPLVASGFSLGRDFENAFPEFSKLVGDERLKHFAEELDCDLQAFVFTSMALPNAPEIPRRAWQDTIGLLFGASATLGSIERVLKLSVSKWSNFARESSDSKELTRESIVLEQFVEDRPLFYVRRWNTSLAVTAALERLGRARNEDAMIWLKYVVEKMQGFVEALDEYLIRELNKLATLEFIAKVYARAQI